MSTFNELSQTVNQWVRWMRFQRSLTWAARGLTLGLALGLAFGSLGLWQVRLLRGEFLTLIGTLTLITPLLIGVIAYLWPIQTTKAARKFDRVFGLNERVSTALELHQTQRHSKLIQQQLEDALARAQNVKPSRDFPLRFKPIEGTLALILAVMIGLIWFRGETWFAAAKQARAVEVAVAAQSQQIEQLLTQIQNNQTLTEEQKQALSEPLQQALNDLNESPSLENSVSVLTSTSEKLQALSDPQAQQMSQALQQAGQNLASQEGSPLQSAGQKLAQGNAVNAANELKNIDVSGLSQEQAQQMTEQLQSMAQSVQATNPQLASQLNQAAQALQQGDMAAAQQALDQAAQQLTQAGQQVTYSQTAGQAAQQMQQGAGQVLAAGGGGQQANQGQDQSGQPGSSQTESNAGSGESGSGTGGSAQSPQTGNEAGSAPIPQDNGAGNGGESGYEQIYAPSLLGGNGGPSVNLPSSGEDGSTIGQGPTTPSEPGQSLVPYSEVYSQYEAANQHAIENGDVPFEFMQVIRNYFNSLQPGGFSRNFRSK